MTGENDFAILVGEFLEVPRNAKTFQSAQIAYFVIEFLLLILCILTILAG